MTRKSPKDPDELFKAPTVTDELLQNETDISWLTFGSQSIPEEELDQVHAKFLPGTVNDPTRLWWERPPDRVGNHTLEAQEPDYTFSKEMRALIRVNHTTPHPGFGVVCEDGTTSKLLRMLNSSQDRSLTCIPSGKGCVRGAFNQTTQPLHQDKKCTMKPRPVFCTDTLR